MIVACANMWGVTSHSLIDKNCLIIMTRLFAHMPGICCMTFLLPIYLFFCQYNITFSIFQQDFAYQNETSLIIRERERERCMREKEGI